MSHQCVGSSTDDRYQIRRQGHQNKLIKVH